MNTKSYIIQKFTFLMILFVLFATSCKTVDESVFFLPFKVPVNCENYFDGEGLEINRQFLKTSDQEMLETIFIRSDDAVANIIFYPGKGGNISWYYPLFKEMAKKGKFNVFAVNFRGYGKSTGAVSVDGIKTDIAAVINFLFSSEQKNNLPYYSCGFSTGCFFALYSVSQYSQIDGTILLAPFTSARDLITKVRADMMWCTFFLKIDIAPTVDLLDNLELVQQNELPLLILHGSRDRLIPPSMGQILFDVSISKNKKIVFIKDSGHDSLTLNNRYYSQVVEQMLGFITSTGLYMEE